MLWIIFLALGGFILYKFLNFNNKVIKKPFMPTFKIFVDELNRDTLSGLGTLTQVDNIEYILSNPYGSALNTKITFKYLGSSLRVIIETQNYFMMNNDGSFDSFSYTFKSLDKIDLDNTTQKKMVVYLKGAFTEYLNHRKTL